MQKNLGKCLFPPIDHRLLTSQAACAIPKKSRNSSNQDCNENHFGVQNGHLHAGSGSPVNDRNKNECLLELERINKEIETVRHEVELEQRRLSCYQTVQGVGSKNATHLFISRSETAGKLDGAFYGCSPCSDVTKTHSRASKYVVDNSKPRTDLEYDPLSNFSADLRSYSSPAKEHSAKKRQDLKIARNAVPFNQKRTVTIQAQLTKLPSPERLDDFGESVLIIDIPPSPDQKIKQVQQHSGSRQDKVEELKDVTTVPVLNNSPQHRVEKDISPTSLVDNNGVDSNFAKNNQCPFSLNDSKECGNIQADGIEVDLPGCLEKLKGDGQNISHLQNAEKELENYLEPESLSCLIDQQDRKNKNPVVERNEKSLQRELSLCELNQSTEKMKPLQTSNFPPNNSLSFQTPPANSDSQCWQHAKQTHTTTPPILNIVGNQWSSTNVLSVSPHCQKTSKKIPEQMLIKATVNHAPLRSQLKLAAPVSDNSQGWPTQNSSASVDKAASSSSTLTGQILQKAESEVVIIDSSSEDELNYSDMEVSDSDPMEECFRIFMEENDDKVNDEQADAPARAMDVEKLESIITPQGLSGKRRVAHEAKHNEQPLAKSRPQPLVLVPLHGPVGSGFGGQTCITSRIQQIQQKAAVLTSSVKGAQALVSSTCQRWPETKSTYPSAQTAENLQNASVQNAFLSYIPLGNAVIGVGSNLQIILSEGAIPLPATSSSIPVTALLTPITQVQTTTVNVKQSYHPPAMTTVQRYRSTTVPLIIPAPARKPSLVSASAHSCPVSSAIPPSATTARPLSTKRKVKQQCETAKEKVPHDIRQRYVNMFTEEFLKTTANVNDAFEKALAEERTVYNRSVNKLKYLSIAVNALKRLKSHGAVAAKNQDEAYSQRLKGNISLNLKKLKRNDNNTFYESLRDYILTKERLIESNYPVKHPENPGSAVLFVDTKKSNADSLKKICCRCGATYSVSQSGKHIRKEECNYHHGKGVKNKVPGGVETRYSCCEAVMGAPGCQVFKLHVHESLNLDGFVSTVPRHPPDSSSPGVYALNCEMCYTVCGLELSRVTLVNSSLQVIYDTFVKPDNEVIDYNTRFSGIDEEDMKGNRTSLRDVQETLLSFISSDTVLIGHSLQTDLCALKLLHGTVVDTSVVFPHRLGPPHKLSLSSLTAEYLRRIIQESVCGHDTAEDASACMELLLWKVKEDGKLKK